MSPEGTTQVVALLGPTNTGKTHRAVERMLEHGTGMLGLPLRLLAREVYDRISARVGELDVALVTGEEKRIPSRPRFWVCTVEAMPLDRPVEFLAVDEIQLAAHPERGHVFTDRLLHARGESETWFLGSDTMRPVIEELVPVASVRRHPRFSSLRRAGAVHLASLPPRSALIAFSAAEVYQLADRLRGRRGGAAVVLGALSPRTRNAQVAMYQSGEVDYLVATDAIGMGLNLDLEHVAFAALTKFDGRGSRALTAQELAQIAGRAGRHVRDGTFGTLAPLEFPEDLAFAIENHRFLPTRSVFWRNSDLDTSSTTALLASLDERPRRRILTLVEKAADSEALRALAVRPDIVAATRSADAVKLLWQVCEIPDFRKVLPEHHAALLADIFLALVQGGGCLEHGFMERNVRRLESAEGDIDTLLMRLQLVRTWRYVAHRAAWLREPVRWQERTERAEDAIGEALHLRLVERFVDRQGRKRRVLLAPAQRRSDPRLVALDAEPVQAGPFAALVALRGRVPGPLAGDSDEAGGWVEELIAASFEAFDVAETGGILFKNERVALLVRGAELLLPEVKLTLARPLGPGRQARVLRRLRAFVRDTVNVLFGRFDPEATDSPLREASGAARGFAYRVRQSLGTALNAELRTELSALSQADRACLQSAGVRLGRRAAFLEQALTGENIRRRVALCSAFLERRPAAAIAPGAVTVVCVETVTPATYARCGFLELGPLAVRADVVESLLDELNDLARAGPFDCPVELAGALGRSVDELGSVLLALGFTETEGGFCASDRARGRR